MCKVAAAGEEKNIVPIREEEPSQDGKENVINQIGPIDLQVYPKGSQKVKGGIAIHYHGSNLFSIKGNRPYVEGLSIIGQLGCKIISITNVEGVYYILTEEVRWDLMKKRSQ